MSSIKYNIVSSEGERVSVTVFIDGVPSTANREHPRFEEICDLLTGSAQKPDDDFIQKIKAAISPAAGIAQEFKNLSERVSVGNGRIYFDGDPVNDAVSETILRFYGGHEKDWMPLVNFMEKIALNPNEHSREQLFRWLAKHSFAIAPDGDIIAYKGVTGNGKDFKSSHSGTARVNGVLHANKQIPTQPNTVVEMPRSTVAWDPKVACHTGLHAGNWRYASTFASTTLRVKINPRDVVSVPTDSNDEKMRVCRYRVLDKVTSEDKSVLFIPDLSKTARPVEYKEPEEEKPAPKPARRAPLKAAPVRGKGKKAPAKKPAPKPEPKPYEFPQYYEDFRKRDFENVDLDELRWLIKEYGVKTVSGQRNKAGYVDALTKHMAGVRRTWGK